MDSELFICPHCGAIYGAPVCKYKKARKKCNVPWRAIIGTLVLLVTLACSALILAPFLFPSATEPPQVDSDSYSVKIVDENGDPVSGVELCIAMDQQSYRPDTVYTDAQGCVLFDGRGLDMSLFCIEIVSVPVGYSQSAIGYHYPEPGATELTIVLETHILFAVRVVDDAGKPVSGVEVTLQPTWDGDIYLLSTTNAYGWAHFLSPYTQYAYVTLENLPEGTHQDYLNGTFGVMGSSPELVIELKPEGRLADFTVKVVDEEGKSIPNVPFRYGHTTISMSFTGVTDETGSFTFSSSSANGMYVSLQYIPTGYVFEDNGHYYFEDGSRELLIVLKKAPETVPQGQALYTIRLLNENQEPLTGAYIRVAHENEEHSHYIYTNQDGCGMILCTDDSPAYVYIDLIPGYPQYKDSIFYFDEGSRELTLILTGD